MGQQLQLICLLQLFSSLAHITCIRCLNLTSYCKFFTHWTFCLRLRAWSSAMDSGLGSQRPPTSCSSSLSAGRLMGTCWSLGKVRCDNTDITLTLAKGDGFFPSQPPGPMLQRWALRSRSAVVGVPRSWGVPSSLFWLVPCKWCCIQLYIVLPCCLANLPHTTPGNFT